LEARGDDIYSPGMSAVVVAASRRALAAFVLLIAGLLAVWAATFKVWYVFAPSVAGGKAGGPYLPPAPRPEGGLHRRRRLGAVQRG
jgi:hypothetical protein